ncbi:DBH-like monooxygenase protein 1 [Penaeus chinensis]|uniref:DBH-like monooxygenase protein 1 n=1 Tax=Penaeus chinensis TaxID=139456 RepID=UPI001FB609F0|nr:DBH-like monooxygenase protein 1 [Penaeus chinensis]
MGTMMLIYLVSTVLTLGIGASALPGERLPPFAFQHAAMLDQRGHFHMLWTPREKDIAIEIQVATHGYVGLGFSSNGGMKGSDIVLGWVDTDGKLHAHDRHAIGNMIPLIDDSQDIEVLGGYENETHTVLRFARPWNTCDKEHDFHLTSDTIRVIWAYSYDDPVTEYAMTKHDHRGTKSIFLQEPHFDLPTFGDDVFTWEVRMNNVSVSGEVDTVYWCQMFKAPPLERKTHVIGYVPIIEHIENVHHMLLYECHVPESEKHYEKWLEVEGQQCFTPNMPLSWANCRSPIVAWAVGSEGEIMPDHVGFPLREEHGGATYFMMEMHYDNPNFRQGIVDSSGLRLFLTETLREHDAGFLVLGHAVEPTHIIPPERQWKSVSHCDGGCITQSVPAEGIHVFQGLLHTHLLGNDITVRQIRNGRELPVVFQDMNYDFNYQQARVLSEEMTILPGDSFLTECGYDSRGKKAPTFGGESTQEEMCLAFLAYYPRSKVSWCVSTPEISIIYNSFGIEEVYDDGRNSIHRNANYKHDEEREKKMVEEMKKKAEWDGKQKAITVDFTKMYKDIVAKAPKELYNVSMYDLIHDPKTWQDEQALDALQERVVSGKHEIFCTDKSHNLFEGYPRTYEYPDFLAIKLLDEECDVSHEAEAYVPETKQDQERNQEEEKPKSEIPKEEANSATSMAMSTSTIILLVCLCVFRREFISK